MAKAIRHIEPHTPTAAETQSAAIADLLKSLADNRDAIVKTIEIVKQLDEMRMLNILTGLLQERTAVAEIALQQINQPTMRNLIKNGMNAFKFLGSLDPQKIDQLMGGLSRGLDRLMADPASRETPSLWQLGKAMREPETRKAISSLLGFLQGFGEGHAGPSREDK